MFAITPTDKRWFDLLKGHQFNSFVNFWTPTPWYVKNPKANDRWYFLLKSPIRKIGGYGELVEYKNLTPFEAWRDYGMRNGCESLIDLTEKIQTYINRNSSKFSGQKIDIQTYRIGCVILKNCQFFDKEDYLDPQDFGLTIDIHVEKHKILRQYDPFVTNTNLRGFNILNEPRDIYRVETNQRKGQGIFKGLILKAYNNKCCISDETCPELLEAAHLQLYLNEQSNHVQNGILIRVDLHRLYDSGLLFIDKDYKIHISSLIKSSIYRKYHGKTISLPENIYDRPSILALELKRESFRR